MFFPLGLNLFKHSMCGRSSDLGAMQLFTEEYASRSGKRWLSARLDSLGGFLLAACVIAGTASR